MNDGDSHLYAWLEQFRLQDSGNASDATHYSLVGGKYTIPDSRHQQWLKRYAMHLQQHAHEPVFFVEKRTPVFRMHFDLDYIQPEVPTLVQIIQMVHLLNTVFATFYPQTEQTADLFVAIVLKAPSLAKGAGITKTGYHVIWPYLLVNCDQALTMRLACITEAIHRFGERTAPYNSYDDLLDECVFMENGLRMVGSDKAKRCDMCDGKRKVNGNMCTTCKGLGKVCEKRVYEPYIVVDARGQLDEVRLSRLVDEDSKHRLVRWCSIRSAETAPTAGYVKPPLAMQVTYESVAKDRKKRKTVKAGGGGGGEIKLVHGCRWLEDAIDVSENKQVRDEVESFIRTGMGCVEWREIIARRMYYSESAGRYLVKTFGMGCQYCLNVHRCHGSSSIYFVIDVSGIVQRCYSKKKFDGIDTPCSKYASPRVQLSKVLLRVLFPSAGYSADTEPAVLSAPVQSTVPFELSDQVVLRQPSTPVHEYVNVLTTLAPRALAAQQLWAQQQAMKLQHALTKQKGAAKGKAGKKPRAVKNAKAAVPATPAILPTAGLKAEQLFAMDKQRAQEQESRVKRLQDEMGNAAKKPKRSNK